MPRPRGKLEYYVRRALNRVRGEPSVARLVADGMQLGENPHIAHPIYFDRLFPWLITIGDHVTLGPYVAIITHDASFAHHTSRTRIARVVIGDRVNVGVGAILLPGAVIGDNSVVGAGAVVSHDVPADSLVVGNPAEISPLKPVAAWHRASSRRSPNWPGEGWTIASGISELRKRQQRDALADGVSGYVPASAAPGSPFELSGERHQP